MREQQRQSSKHMMNTSHCTTTYIKNTMQHWKSRQSESVVGEEVLVEKKKQALMEEQEQWWR